MFFLLYIQFESIFYFTPAIKSKIVIFLILSIISFLILYIYQYLQAINGKIEKYKLSQVSKFLGKKLYPNKSDKILNALQIESALKTNESEQLANLFLKNISNSLFHTNLIDLFKNHRLISLKQIFLIFSLCAIFIFSLRYQDSKYAFNRLIKVDEIFYAPKPFSLINLTEELHILGGEVAIIDIKAFGSSPDTVELELSPIQESIKARDSLKLNFYSSADSNGIYQFKLPRLYQDYSYTAIVRAEHFWEAWEQVSSVPETIYVTDRPDFESFEIIIKPPKYSRLPRRIQEGNLSSIETLKGSQIDINLESNRILESANISFIKDKIEMSIKNKSATGSFIVNEESSFTVNLFDKRGITNRDPIPYKVKLIMDQYPQLYVKEPKEYIELGSDQTLFIDLELQDDFGFNSLQIGYQVNRPKYLNIEPFVSMKKISDLRLDSLIQTIQTYWELNDLNLMPDDEVQFYFELTDNDDVSGPKKTTSKKFIAKVPSLADLYTETEILEGNFIEDLKEELENINDLKSELKDIELETLKTNELTWEQKQSINNSIEKVKAELKKLEEISEAIEAVSEQAEKHDLFSEDLLGKFNELSELIKDIMPEDMFENIKDITDSMDEMNMDALNEAINSLAENMDKIQEDLDRYLKVFKRLQAEQKMDELQKRIENLFKQQESLSKKLNEINQNEELVDNQRLMQEEKRVLEELENIKALISEAEQLTEPFNKMTSTDLKDFKESDNTNQTFSNLEETIKSLSNKNMNLTKQSAANSTQNLQKMNQAMSDIKKEFQNQTVEEMSGRFQAILQDLLYLSSQEEELQSQIKSSSRNSPRLREFASRQQLLQDQLQSITQKMLELSKETFSITPQIGRAIGKANYGMQEAKKNLTDKNLIMAKENQNNAIIGLNESALEIFNSMQEMQNSGSASGYEQFLSMMQEMSEQQQSLNQQGMQLSLGQMNPSMQNQIMREMLEKQKGIGKTLEQLIKEMKGSGEQNGLGNMNEIKRDIDDVVNDLQRKRFNKKTESKQEKILSRMLDSQLSMTERDYKEERKAVFSTKIIKSNISGLPNDLGQRKSITLKALNSAMRAGYSKEHQDMIKYYFNSLDQLGNDE